MKATFWLMATLWLTALGAIAQEFTAPGWFRPVERTGGPQLKGWSEAGEQEADPEISGGFGMMSLVSAPEIAEAITPEIEALARGLENDPARIFAYVRDRIRYVHYFGSKKGAQLTLLERSGNDFDQCALLVALLRAAGHTASYRFGTVAMPYELTSGLDYHRDFKHWLGLTEPNSNWTNSLVFAYSLNDFRGFPFTGGFLDVPNVLVLHRVWVRLSWNETVYSLDPAFKVYEPVAGINLTTAMGLDTNALMTAAGGTSTADYVQSLSEVNLRNKLRDYTTNLLSYLQNNHPNATVEQITGGHYLAGGQSFGGDLPFTPFVWEDTSPAVDWDYIPTNLMATLTITVDATTNRFLVMPQLQGQKLALTFSTNGLGELWLDDELLLQKQTSGGSTVNVGFSIDHPHGTWDWANNSLINTNWNDHVVTNAYQRTNASYVLTYSFEMSPEWLRQRQERLDVYRDSGLADTSREVVTETLNVMGLNWMLQTERIPTVLAAQRELLLQHHHRLGRMAQENGKGYYIDVYQQLNGLYPASGSDSNSLAGADRFFDVANYFGSAAEHGLIEQLQGSNWVAASTVKMLQLANTNGQKTFVAQSSNWTTGANVRSQISNYNLGYLDDYINAGYTLLLPQNGSNLVAGAGSWAGYGIAARGLVGGYYTMAMLIDGGYHGGFVGNSGATVDTPAIVQINTAQPDYFVLTSPYVGSPLGADPVNMVDGSFQVSETDLSRGDARAPRGVEFIRHYSSSRRHHDPVALGKGWTHNYDLRAAEVSAPLAGLGDTTPAQMAPMLVATRAALELYGSTPNPKNWAVVSLISKWGVDQLIKNAVTVTLGNDTIQFVKQPNGAFTPPASSTMTLLKTNSTYRLLERHGNTYQFSSYGRVTNIVDQYGKNTRLQYYVDATNILLLVATDWKGRGFRLEYPYAPYHVSRVLTETRNIVLGYGTNANGGFNLLSVRDPEEKTRTFVYDQNNQITAIVDPLNRLIVSNVYDAFGRVVTQYTQGDTNQTWNLYWSGFENVEENPAGGKRRYFYDEKRRLVALQDAMGNTTHTGYDGQDHVTMTVSPLNETNLFVYDGRHNRVLSIDPLGFTNEFSYTTGDLLWRSVDRRGLASTFGYNSKFQLTGSTNGAGDWVNFAYDSGDGTLTSRMDAGGTTTYGHDTNGLVNRITYPGSLGSEGFLNSWDGDLLSHTNARGFVTSYQYNRRREITNTIAPTNLTTRVAFDDAANVAAITDARGFTTSNAWSATRKLLATTLPTTPSGVPVTSHYYDNRDWLAHTVGPLQQITRFTNDAAQRLIGVTDPLQRTTRFGYDATGRQIASTNAALEPIRREWSPRGELTKLTDGANRVVGRAYDPAGNQTWLTNRNGKAWQFHFDGANRLTNTVTPLGRSTKQSYNNRGLLQTLTEPSTESTTFHFDAKGRLTNRVDGVAGTVFRYDANNNVTNIIEAGKTNAWTFDAYDRVGSYRDAAVHLIQYRYDPNGNLTNLVYPGSRNVFYAYDSLNRLTNVTDWNGGITSLEYDLGSRLRKITRPNGTVRELGYDLAGQVTNIVEKLTNNFPIAFFRLNWNAAGRVGWEFAAPLPQSNSVPAGTMTFDDDNRLATFNSQTVVHDADGNMTTGPLTNNTLVSLTYDARNRLRSAGGLSYGYGPNGDRVAVTNGAEVTQFVVNPNAPLSQVLMRTKGGVTNYYIHGAGLLYEITETATSTNTLTYHYDYRGSTVALTGANGLPTDRFEYSVYGSLTYRAGTNDTPFQFNGRYGVQTDPNGLLYMRARYYNPYICRFINADPAGFAGGLNHYAYADGNPVSLIDPFGLGAEGTWETPSWLDRSLFAFSDAVAWAGEQALNVAGGIFNAVDAALSGRFPHTGGVESSPAALLYIGSALLTRGGTGVATANTGTRALVPMSENLFANGTSRTVAGYHIYGNSGLVGSTYNVNVLGLYAQEGSQGLRALSSAFQAEAQAAGATRISISGNTIINPGISGLSPAAAGRFGYQLQSVNNQTIILTAPVPPP